MHNYCSLDYEKTRAAVAVVGFLICCTALVRVCCCASPDVQPQKFLTALSQKRLPSELEMHECRFERGSKHLKLNVTSWIIIESCSAHLFRPIQTQSFFRFKPFNFPSIQTRKS